MRSHAAHLGVADSGRGLTVTSRAITASRDEDAAGRSGLAQIIAGCGPGDARSSPTGGISAGMSSRACRAPISRVPDGMASAVLVGVNAEHGLNASFVGRLPVG